MCPALQGEGQRLGSVGRRFAAAKGHPSLEECPYAVLVITPSFSTHVCPLLLVFRALRILFCVVSEQPDTFTIVPTLPIALKSELSIDEILSKLAPERSSSISEGKLQNEESSTLTLLHSIPPAYIYSNFEQSVTDTDILILFSAVFSGANLIPFKFILVQLSQ